MPGRTRAVTTIIKYGPALAAAAQRYGPQVWDTVKTQREPAERYVQAKVTRGNHRKKALAHADTVVTGSVQQVFHQSQSYWIVFSGDEPIGVHPRTAVPYQVLLRNADPDKRVRPGETHRIIKVPKRRPRPGPGQRPTA